MSALNHLQPTTAYAFLLSPIPERAVKTSFPLPIYKTFKLFSQRIAAMSCY
jgi:hypothetical protein